MKNLKASFYIDFKEIKIDISIKDSSTSQITALHLSKKSQFLNSYFNTLANSQTPFVLNPNLTFEDALIFSKDVNAHNIISDDQTTIFESSQEIPLGHITCSSGTTSTTGKIKRFSFSLEQITSNAKAHYHSLGVFKSSNILFPLPLYHSFGLVVGLIGASIFNHNTYTFEETPTSEVLIKTILDKDIDILYLTPALLRNFNRYLKRKKINISKEIIISIGAAHLYKSDLIDLKKSFPTAQIFYTYGLSELGPRVSTYKVPKLLENIKHHNDLLPIGEVIDPRIKMEVRESQLEIRSPFSFIPKAINTHDEVFQDIDNNIFILGRTDFTINFAGVNIYPEEVEAKLLPHLKDFEFIVTGLNSSLYGEVPVIILENSQNREINKQALLELCSKNLPEHLQINQIFIVEHFPRTAMGKIQRKHLKNLINIA